MRICKSVPLTSRTDPITISSKNPLQLNSSLTSPSSTSL